MTDTRETQRQRLLDALRQGPVTTDQAKDLGIASPGRSVWELRHWQKVRIATLLSDNKKTKGWMYVLLPDQIHEGINS